MTTTTNEGSSSNEGTTTSVQDTSAETPSSELLLPVEELIAHPYNVRSDVGDLDGLVASIREVGVLQPITVTKLPDGGFGVVFGSRRLAAAKAAGLTLIPARLRDDLAAPVDVISTGLVENAHRKEMTPVETAKAYTQLAGFGLSLREMTKRTGTKAAEVKKALTAGRSELAVAAGERFGFLRLDHLVVFAEFESDPEALKVLARVAKENPRYFDHQVSEFRQAREIVEQRKAAIAELTAAGVRVVDTEADDFVRGSLTPLSRLVTNKGKDVTEKSHARCPGHVASVSHYHGARVSYFCDDPAKYGHESRYGTPLVSGASRGSSSERPGLSDEERAQRARTRKNNLAMDAANPVRRHFVVELLARKSVPKGTLRYVAENLSGDPSGLGDVDDDLLATLLTIPKATGATRFGNRHDFGVKAVGDSSDVRLPVVLLAHVASSIEARWDKEAWRHVDARKVRWLNFLAGQGYALAAVEKEMVEELASREQRAAELAIRRTAPARVNVTWKAVDGEGEPEA